MIDFCSCTPARATFAVAISCMAVVPFYRTAKSSHVSWTVSTWSWPAARKVSALERQQAWSAHLRPRVAPWKPGNIPLRTCRPMLAKKASRTTKRFHLGVWRRLYLSPNRRPNSPVLQSHRCLTGLGTFLALVSPVNARQCAPSGRCAGCTFLKQAPRLAPQCTIMAAAYRIGSVLNVKRSPNASASCVACGASTPSDSTARTASPLLPSRATKPTSETVTVAR